jgi:hypothetical protein
VLFRLLALATAIVCIVVRHFWLHMTQKAIRVYLRSHVGPRTSRSAEEPLLAGVVQLWGSFPPFSFFFWD